MARTSTNSSTESINSIGSSDRIKFLYPSVYEEDTPLPRSWNPKDKFSYLGLSQNNLRVHYKGLGKSHKDAASVRATHAIPAACGIHYFEVKIVSKGRDGYMGVGLSAHGVSLNRLPGWDKQSYGYHGDDGHSFCSSGTGQPYGPTFTTGDVIGCCLNLIDNTCFYTKNGVHLGIAFRDLPQNLYPTVGLQTPGEVVEANFGQAPFVFDIEDYMKEWKVKTRQKIERLPVADKQGEWQTALQKIVSTYLVHHGYCATAESFARHTGQNVEEDLQSIKNRQRIQRLVLAGRMGEAIHTTQQLYPGLLERDPSLLFSLKCRQFIEMVNGTDSEVRGMRSPRSLHGSARSSPCASPSHLPPTGLLTSSPAVHRSASTSQSPGRAGGGSGSASPNRQTLAKAGGGGSHASSRGSSPAQAHGDARSGRSEAEMNALNLVMNGGSSGGEAVNGAAARDTGDDVDMEEAPPPHVANGVTQNGVAQNGVDEHMDTDAPYTRRQMCGGNQAATEKMLQFGRELQAMSNQLRQSVAGCSSDEHARTLQDAFSLLAYQDPWSSPVGWQLDPVQREPVCAALNSAILESRDLPKQPPLELALGQATQTMRLMSKCGIGSCAFVNMQLYMPNH